MVVLHDSSRTSDITRAQIATGSASASMHTDTCPQRAGVTNWKKLPYRTSTYSRPPQSMLPRCVASLSRVGFTKSLRIDRFRNCSRPDCLLSIWIRAAHFCRQRHSECSRIFGRCFQSCSLAWLIVLVLQTKSRKPRPPDPDLHSEKCVPHPEKLAWGLIFRIGLALVLKPNSRRGGCSHPPTVLRVRSDQRSDPARQLRSTRLPFSARRC